MKPEPNRFHPAGAWRLRGRLRELAADARDLAVSLENAIMERNWGDVDYCAKRLPAAAVKLARFYAERKTASAARTARLARELRREARAGRKACAVNRALQDGKQ